MIFPQGWQAQVLDIAKAAGEAILRIYQGEFAVEHKQDNTPLTQADLAAHAVIENGLASLMPSLPVLSEESAAIPFSERQGWDTYWLVDPLDGTKEFIKRNGEFTVNIALVHAGQPVFGLVYAPVTGLIYYAIQGQGAYKQTRTGPPVRIRARPLDLSHITVAVSRSHRGPRMEQFLQNLARNYSPPDLISMGSSLKICLVAEGQADVYPRLGLTSEWDTAAAQCILEEAGGHIMDVPGRPLRYNSKDSLLNPEFFACGASVHAWQQYL